MMHPLPESARRRLQMQVADAHPDPGLLTAFSEQSLTSAERDAVLHHLALCAACREIVALAAPAAVPTEVPAPVTRPWFRWPALHWVALAATAVIVWAAVSVLAPRTASRHDVSVPAESAANTPPTPAFNPKSQPKTPGPASLSAAPAVTARVKKTSPLRESAPATNELAKAEQNTARNSLDTTAKDVAAPLKVQAGLSADEVGNADVAAPRPARPIAQGSLIARIAPSPLPPAPPRSAETELKNAPASGAPAAITGGVVVKNELPSAAFTPSTGRVGGPVASDALRVGFADGREMPIIAGTITDPSGAVVPNALVRITNTKANSSTAVRTDSSGTYRTPVTPGVYSVEASSPGMQAAHASDVAIAGAVAQNLTLRPGAVMEAVTVTAANTALAPATLPAAAQPERQSAKREERAETLPRAVAPPKAKSDVAASPYWRITPQGALEQSADGTSWTKLATAPSAVFRAVFTRGNDVWAAGERGALFHSSDAGRTWTPVPVGPAGSPIADTIAGLSFSTGGAGSVTTSSGDIWLTADGGRTWRRR